jgi:hypothetical protein
MKLEAAMIVNKSAKKRKHADSNWLAKDDTKGSHGSLTQDGGGVEKASFSFSFFS